MYFLLLHLVIYIGFVLHCVKCTGWRHSQNVRLELNIALSYAPYLGNTFMLGVYMKHRWVFWKTYYVQHCAFQNAYFYFFLWYPLGYTPLGWCPSSITYLWSNTHLYFHHMCFILNNIRCCVSTTSSSRNHFWNAKEKE